IYNFFFSSRRRHTRSKRDWSSDVCSSDLELHDLPKDLRNKMTSIKLSTDTVLDSNKFLQALFTIFESTYSEYIDKGFSEIKLKRSEERRVGKECRTGWWRCADNRQRE